ncbi:hypothetical protein SteCoe_16492 [Stentor coeruleus]|uniref:Uncharacterized protein n=1 Tax=Stentor coeruleus TaxID=5963 RepID=A0A1R2C154_9CILI|nr:hypothetical protein SteCoe_16492 [Stentor coeruleus]
MMELKKNHSDKILKKSVSEINKLNPLVTFQRFPINQNPALYPQPSMPNLACQDEDRLKVPIRTSKFFENRSKNFTILPPIGNMQKLKFHELSNDLFPRVLLQSDCRTLRKQKTEEELIKNYSQSEKKIPKRQANVKNHSCEKRVSKVLRTNLLYCVTDMEQIPTPTFRNSVMPESFTTKIDDFDTENHEDYNIRSQSEILRGKKSHVSLLRSTFKVIPKNIGKPECDLANVIRHSLPGKASNGRQKIKVLNRGLPKDVFTVNENHSFK